MRCPRERWGAPPERFRQGRPAGCRLNCYGCGTHALSPGGPLLALKLHKATLLTSPGPAVPWAWAWAHTPFLAPGAQAPAPTCLYQAPPPPQELPLFPNLPSSQECWANLALPAQGPGRGRGSSPVFDEGLKVPRETHVAGQEWGLFLQDFGEDLEVRLAVLVGKLARGQFHLGRDRQLGQWRPGSALPMLNLSRSRKGAVSSPGPQLTKEMPRLHTSARMS